MKGKEYLGMHTKNLDLIMQKDSQVLEIIILFLINTKVFRISADLKDKRKKLSCIGSET